MSVYICVIVVGIIYLILNKLPMQTSEVGLPKRTQTVMQAVKFLEHQIMED